MALGVSADVFGMTCLHVVYIPATTRSCEDIASWFKITPSVWSACGSHCVDAVGKQS